MLLLRIVMGHGLVRRKAWNSSVIKPGFSFESPLACKILSKLLIFLQAQILHLQKQMNTYFTWFLKLSKETFSVNHFFH